jgi:hypothetical protein
MGSHSRTTEVWVALRQRRTGAVGEADPNCERRSDWRREKCASEASSAARSRATEIVTMEPEWMSGGRRIEGNSI